jgi:hypothetical protein
MQKCVCFMVVLFLSSAIGAQAQGSSKTQVAKHIATQKMPTVSSQLQAMQDLLKKQQGQLEQQQTQIRELQQQLQQGDQRQQHQAEQVQNSVEQVSSEFAAVKQTAETLTTAVTDLKIGQTTTAQALTATQTSVKMLEAPMSLRYKGVTLTPGGFIDVDMFARTRNENADLCTSFGGMPFGGTANSHLSEFRGSARASRLSLLSEGMAGRTKLSGYYEIDFLVQAPNANQIETNSFSPRQRQLWAQLDFNNGVTLTVGQPWSLITTNRKGIATRAEYIPNTSEASYVVGYNYVRQTGIRVTKNFQNKTWLAIEVANPETTYNASYAVPNVMGLNDSPNALSPAAGLLPYLKGSTNGFSTNLAPDLIAKAAFEPGWGHYEIKLLGRTFRDRLNGHNNLSYGGGVGVAAILPLVPKKADFILEGLAGSGIGRYAAGLGPDVTLRPDGWLMPLHTAQLFTGLEFHPTPKFDINVYGGDEYYDRSPYVSPTGTAAGYGSHLVNNTNCGVEVVPSGGAPCGAQNRNIWEASTGMWYRPYKGPMGIFQFGWQVEYLYRGTWSGIGGAPKGLDLVSFGSARYYLP